MDFRIKKKRRRRKKAEKIVCNDDANRSIDKVLVGINHRSLLTGSNRFYLSRYSFRDPSFCQLIRISCPLRFVCGEGEISGRARWNVVINIGAKNGGALGKRAVTALGTTRRCRFAI